jgi:hypothetical protein
MRKILVAISTAFINIGLVGAAAPAQAHPIVAHSAAADAYVATKESVAQKTARRMATSYLKYSAFSRSGLTSPGGTAAHASKIERELYLVPAGIGDSSCKNGTLQYGISLDALPNVARSILFKTTVPRRGIITFDDVDVDQYASKAWYSACVSRGGYKVIAASKRLKVTGKDVATGRKVAPRNVKVYVTDC